MRSLYFKIFVWFWLAMALVGTAFVISTVTLQNSEANSRWRAFVASGMRFGARPAIEAYQENGREGLVSFLDGMERNNDFEMYLFDASGSELAGRAIPEGGRALVEQAIAADELAVDELDDSRLVALQVVSSEGTAYVLLAEMDWPFRGGRGRNRFDGRPGEPRARGSSDRDQPGVAGEARGGQGFDENRRARGDSDFRGNRGSGFRDGGRGGRNRSAAPPWYMVWMSAIDQPGELGLRLLAVFLTAGILCYGLARYLTAPVLRLRDATHQLAEGDLSVRIGQAVGTRRDELAELGRDFDVMAERIESLLTSQRQLLSDVSHELRSPLARLNVALALARQRTGDEVAGPLDRIEAEAEQLNALIGRVLTLSRFESGAVEPEFAPVDLSRLVVDIAADADFEANAKDASVVVSASEACHLQGNEPLLRSAIENIVRNAVRYTSSGTNVDVELTFEDIVEEELVDNAAAARYAVVSVRDHGPGVPEEQLENLFEPFYRIADSRARESGGTGLGLSIAERAVRLHGGTVGARNAVGGGLVVEIRLLTSSPVQVGGNGGSRA